MLFNSDISLDKAQYIKGRERPGYSDPRRFSCPVCNRKMHGHGWRLRYCCDKEGESIQIWVHRLICPECRRTATVLPSFVHALKVYSLRIIREAIRRIRETGRKRRSIIGRNLQGKWWASYLLKRACGDLRDVSEMQNPSGRPYVVDTEKPEDAAALLTGLRSPHQLLVLLPSALHP